MPSARRNADMNEEERSTRRESTSTGATRLFMSCVSAWQMRKAFKIRGRTSASRSAFSLCRATSSEHCVVNVMRTTMHAAVTRASTPSAPPPPSTGHARTACRCRASSNCATVWNTF